MGRKKANTPRQGMMTVMQREELESQAKKVEEKLKITYNKSFSENSILLCDIVINENEKFSNVVFCPANGIERKMKQLTNKKPFSIDVFIHKEVGETVRRG